MASTEPQRDFIPLPHTNLERNVDRWTLTELRRILMWASSVSTHVGKHKRSMMWATLAEMLSSAAAVIEGRLQV